MPYSQVMKLLRLWAHVGVTIFTFHRLCHWRLRHYVLVTILLIHIRSAFLTQPTDEKKCWLSPTPLSPPFFSLFMTIRYMRLELWGDTDYKLYRTNIAHYGVINKSHAIYRENGHKWYRCVFPIAGLIRSYDLIW